MKLRLNRHTAASSSTDDKLAAFERLWLLRVGGIVVEASAALSLVGELCGDRATWAALLGGDNAARRQLSDAFGCIAEVGDRFLQLGEPPVRLASVQSILAGSFRAFASAAQTFADATAAGGVDLDLLGRVPTLIDEGRAMFAELHRGES